MHSRGHPHRGTPDCGCAQGRSCRKSTSRPSGERIGQIFRVADRRRGADDQHYRLLLAAVHELHRSSRSTPKRAFRSGIIPARLRSCPELRTEDICRSLHARGRIAIRTAQETRIASAASSGRIRSLRSIESREFALTLDRIPRHFLRRDWVNRRIHRLAKTRGVQFLSSPKTSVEPAGLAARATNLGRVTMTATPSDPVLYPGRAAPLGAQSTGRSPISFITSIRSPIRTLLRVETVG